MRNLRLYLDTSVLSHLFHDDAPEKKDATLEFFETVVAPKIHYSFISSVVIDEINRTRDEIRRRSLLEAVNRYNIPLLGYDINDGDLTRLAQMYIERGTIPPNKLEDALHVAIATTHEMDLLVSWNYRHLANINKEGRINSINLAEGYLKPLRLITPLEALNP